MPGQPGTSENHRIAVALTFDFDAESAWLNPTRGEPPVALSRWVYGVYEGVPRILRLLDTYGLPATFFIPGATCDNHTDVVRTIVAAGHEIGHHGYYHEAPHVLTVDEERTMIERGLEAIQRIAGVTPRGYRSPSWELSKATFGLLAEYGMEYDASQLARDRPYWVEDQGKRLDLVEVPSAWELCDSAHFLFSFSPFYLVGMSVPSKVEEIWRSDFDGMYAEGGDVCYVLTMHPKIIGRPHRMRMLERTIQYIQQHDGVWWAQMHEIADEFRRGQAG